MPQNKTQCPLCYSTDLYKYGKDKHGLKSINAKNANDNLLLKLLKTENPKIESIRPAQNVVKLHFYIIAINTIISLDAEIKNVTILSKSQNLQTLKILLDLYLYYLNQSSTRDISRLLKDMYDIDVSYVTITNRSKKFAPIFQEKTNKLRPQTYSNLMNSILMNSSKNQWRKILSLGYHRL